MNKRARIWIATLVSIISVIGLMTGCTTSSAPAATSAPAVSDATTPASEAPTENPLAERIEITAACWDQQPFTNEGADAVRDAIYSKLNIKINPIPLTWDDADQKIQVWAASDQLPDLFGIAVYGTPNFKTWTSQGLVKEIPSDLSAYPILNQLFQSENFLCYKYPLGAADGKFYCIPRPNYRDVSYWANDLGVIIRKDWMEKLGYTEPQSMDQYIALMKAFANDDPDGNGKNDTIGLTCYSTLWLGYLFSGSCPNCMDGAWSWLKGGDGKYIPAFFTDECKQGVVAVKKLYDEGGLDKDFAVLKEEEGMDKFASGQAGAYAHMVSPLILDQLNTKWEKLNPGKSFADSICFLKPFPDKDGNRYRYIAPGCWSESYINAKCDDKKVDRILRFYDYMFSQEAVTMQQYGIEGVDYTKDGDKFVMIDQKKADGTVLTMPEKYPCICVFEFVEWGGTKSYIRPAIPEELRTMSKEFLDWQLANCKPMPTNLLFGFVDYPSRDKNVEIFSDDLAKAIMSDDAGKTWDDLNKTYMDNGYQTIIQDFNDAIAAIGLK